MRPARQQVDPRIAHISSVELIADDPGNRTGGTHPLEVLVRGGVRRDGIACLRDRLFDRLGDVAPSLFATTCMM